MSSLVDLQGRTFGRLQVIRRSENRGTSTAWLCRCVCGTERSVAGKHLTSERTRSCGCILSDAAKTRAALHGVPDNTSHGHGRSRANARTTTYVVWSNMIQRTRNPNNPAWDSYGGRGITVCAEWADYTNFLADMGERPPGLSLDRIDNDGNYEPGNCRWATWSQQRLNQRRRKVRA